MSPVICPASERASGYITAYLHSLLVAPAFSIEKWPTVTALVSTTRACFWAVVDEVTVQSWAGANLDVSFDLAKHHDDEEEESNSVESFVHFGLSYGDGFDCDWDIDYRKDI